MTDFKQIATDLLAKARDHDDKYSVDVNDEEFIVHPDVFSPKYFGSTHFMLDTMPFKDGRVLDLGTGTGVIAVFLAKNGADSVHATDISEAAVKTAKKNVEHHDLSNTITVSRGDLFNPVEDVYDAIYWNAPFQAVEEPCSTVEKQLFDQDYTMMSRFFKEFKTYLKSGSKAYVTFSPTMGSPRRFHEERRHHGVKSRTLATKTQEREGESITLHLLELR